jgi:membrane complex biogenesis BtpA family protein
MPADRLAWLQKTHPTVIGMIHLPPLAGSPRYAGDWLALQHAVLRDTAALTQGGVDALMLENFGDSPFFPGRVPAETVAQMTALAALVKSEMDLPLGINVLRNDGQTALAIALAVEAAFIRVNVLCGARVTDQGLIQGIAHDLLRDRARLQAENIAILADVDVKHSAPLARLPLAQEVADLLERGGADGVIVSGTGTGQATSAEEVQQVTNFAGTIPVFVGSGVSLESAINFLPAAAGFIVGTNFKQDGKPENPVDQTRVREFMNQLPRLS